MNEIAEKETGVSENCLKDESQEETTVNENDEEPVKEPVKDDTQRLGDGGAREDSEMARKQEETTRNSDHSARDTKETSRLNHTEARDESDKARDKEDATRSRSTEERDVVEAARMNVVQARDGKEPARMNDIEAHSAETNTPRSTKVTSGDNPVVPSAVQSSHVDAHKYSGEDLAFVKPAGGN